MKPRGRLLKKLPVLVPILLLALDLPAFATNGLNLIGYGARSTSLGGAFTAVSDDTASINTNPAGLTQIQSRSLELSLDFSVPSLDHGDVFSGVVSGPRKLVFVPWLGYAQKLKGTPLTVGIAVFTQGGVGSEYNGIKTAFGTEDDLFVDLQYMRIAPAIAYQLSDRLSVGFAFFVGRSMLDLQFFPNTSCASLPPPLPSPLPCLAFIPPGPSGSPTFFGLDLDGAEAWGVGGRIGILYQATDWLSLGLQYATPSSLDHNDGDLVLDMSSIGLGKVKYEGSLDDFSWPQELSLGVAFRLIKGLQVSADLKWINWDGALNTPVLKARNPNVPVSDELRNIDIPMKLNWKNQWVFALGLAYNVTDRLVMRGGYNRGNNPVPGETLSPLFATILEDHFAIGLGYTFKTFSFDLTYIRGLTEKVSYTNPDLFFFNAFEKATLNSVEFMIRYRFGGF